MAWHSSGSDPYYTAEAGSRFGYYGVRGYPTCIFNGTLWSVGGSSATYDNYLAMYEYCRRTPSPLTITYLGHSFGGGKASISVKIKLEEAVAAGHNVYFVLWEDKLHYGGKDFYFVERALANPETLTVKNAKEEQIIKREFTVGSGWNTANLGVSVFVQNPSSKAVLQARAVRLVEGVDVDATSFGRVKALYN